MSKSFPPSLAPWIGLSLAGALACALSLAEPASSRAAGFEQVGVEGPVSGAPGVRETVWQSVRPPGGDRDRLRVHRYRGAVPSRAALLYLPGTFMNGVVAVADEDHNLWLFLAARGVEVWALDYRTHAVPADADPAALAFMRAWTLEAFTEDARAAAALARSESGHGALFVSGFSRGVTLAWAFACTEPVERVAGIVVLDGTFKSHDPQDAFDHEAAVAKLAASSQWASDVAGGIGWESRHRLMSAAAADPGAPALREGYANVGDQVARILYDAWRPGGLANAVDGVSRVEVLAALLDGYDRFYPAIQNAGGRSIADRPDDARTPIDDRWGELSLPVLYFGATGMGPGWILDGVYTSVRSGSEDVTLHVLEGYGHLDVLVGERARAEVFVPILEWIREREEREPSPSPAPPG